MCTRARARADPHTQQHRWTHTTRTHEEVRLHTVAQELLTSFSVGTSTACKIWVIASFLLTTHTEAKTSTARGIWVVASTLLTTHTEAKESSMLSHRSEFQA